MKDFDAFFKEMEREPITFKLFDAVVELPPSLPATLVLKMVKAHKEYGNNSIPDAVQMDFAITVFGEERVNIWADKGLDLDQLTELITWTMEQYNMGKQKAQKKGEKVNQ